LVDDAHELVGELGAVEVGVFVGVVVLASEDGDEFWGAGVAAGVSASTTLVAWKYCSATTVSAVRA
jgi:hypothetical protein